MIIEFGPTPEYVYRTADNSAVSAGRTLEAMIETYEDMVSENVDIRISQALHNAMLTTDTETDAHRRFQRTGEYLIGINESDQPTDKSDKPYDALMLAQGSEPDQRGAFSFVSLGIWVRRRSLARGKAFAGTSLRDNLLHKSLVDIGVPYEIADWGVPVRYSTVITNLDECDAYLYGKAARLEEIELMEAIDDQQRTIIYDAVSADCDASLAQACSRRQRERHAGESEPYRITPLIASNNSLKLFELHLQTQ